MDASVLVVAVHGNGGGARRFSLLSDPLADDVLLRAVTLPGFGAAPADPSLRSVADYADRLAELIEAERRHAELADGDPVVVLGHGIGGSIALDLASRRPSTLDGLLLHAPVGADLDTRWFPRVMRSTPVRRAVRIGISSPLARPLLRRVFFPDGAPREVLDGFFEDYRRCASFDQMFDIIDAAWFDALAPVDGLAAVVVWGSGDRVLRSGQADAITAKVPGAASEVIEGWDHFPMLEQPDEYAEVIARLARRLVRTDAS